MMGGVGHEIKFESPLSQDKYSLVGFTFVESTDIVEEYITRTEVTIEDVYIIMNKDINI